MMPEEQIKALAELDGWTKTFEDEWGPLRGFKDSTNMVYVMPPYLTSYDAIIPLIQKQDEEVQRIVWDELCPQRVSLNPAKLAEALLRATGKRKGSE